MTGIAVVQGLASKVGKIHARVIRVGGVRGVMVVMILQRVRCCSSCSYGLQRRRQVFCFDLERHLAVDRSPEVVAPVAAEVS